MKTVQVLLSTYNGEKYLGEQLESLVNQEGVKIKILVRDDGSTDSTVDILDKYSKNGKLDYFTDENIGYAKSFFMLASKCSREADYYAFCDQDDFWESRKLISAVTRLDACEFDKPKLYFSNMDIVDKDLNKIGFKNYTNKKISLGDAMARFNISGCTMVFNDKLLELVIINRNYEELKIGHDAWIYFVCLSIGGQVIFDQISYIKYRQHGNNVTGVRQGVANRISREMKVFNSKKDAISECAKVIIKEYSDLIPNNNLALLIEIATYKNSPIKKIKLISNCQLKCGIIIIDVFIRIQIFFNCF